MRWPTMAERRDWYLFFSELCCSTLIRYYEAYRTKLKSELDGKGSNA